MSTAISSTRSRSLLGNTLIFLPALALGMSAIMKFAGVPAVVREMSSAGFAGERLMLVATLEIFSAVLFLYPRTRSLGVLFLSAFLGGAICTHVQMGELPKTLPPSLLLVFAWIGVWLRHPQVLRSFGPSSPSSVRFEDARPQPYR